MQCAFCQTSTSLQSTLRYFVGCRQEEHIDWWYAKRTVWTHILTWWQCFLHIILLSYKSSFYHFTVRTKIEINMFKVKHKTVICRDFVGKKQHFCRFWLSYNLVFKLYPWANSWHRITITVLNYKYVLNILDYTWKSYWVWGLDASDVY